MTVRAGLVLVAALLLTPAVLTAGQSWLMSREEVSRPVLLQGPIVAFRQTATQVEVRLDRSIARPASGAMRLKIVDPANPGSDPLQIELDRGQTFATAKLPEHLARAGMLGVTVENVPTLALK